mmetsp:Transcript_15090/g.34845  ORF Transcript_15090/g.34845 Transcript_15090/m.34845 type:complete len:241 (+) Transcript_15090:56-778(+)|eukprot:CAMPEP_0116844486 /NCGR_PEP_ID=MMETSP0418-20121206/12720_1 /TAXON_ID=1158023 /ORGANISM="Astrosyne radiata, Strain 13vi08-1A" /LENGTH=240 /DNA_ID=CAMNT_0004475455 /DNA_START=31 /DNA_END=753 /DNA_ORIENTATION=+
MTDVQVTAESLVGFYIRNPVENYNHKVAIKIVDEKLIWKNAEQIWDLMLGEDNVLYLNETCPHYEKGVTSVEIEMEGTEITGLVLMGDVFEPVRSGGGRSTSPIPSAVGGADDSTYVFTMPNIQERLEGRYERQPVENETHVIHLDYDNDVLTWENDAGQSWVLTPPDDDDDVNEDGITILQIGDDCPHYKDGVREASVEIQDHDIVGIQFMGELYRKTNVVGEDESECAVYGDDAMSRD